MERADPVKIVNAALGQLGDLTIYKRMEVFSRTGCGSSNALSAAFDHYDFAKEQMLGALDWSRARKTKALTVSADDPLVTAWSYKYARPADCLILRKVIDEDETEYEWEAMREENSVGQDIEWIYCNAADVYARYTVDVGEEQYNSGMAQLHALYLAEMIAPTVTGNAAKVLMVTERLRRRAELLCLALGAREGYVEDEKGEHELTDLF